MAAREGKGESEMLLTAEQLAEIKVSDNYKTCGCDRCQLLRHNDAVVERVKALYEGMVHEDRCNAYGATNLDEDDLRKYDCTRKTGQVFALLSELGGE